MKKKVATLKDVARHVGVHPSTVSRALSVETRDLVADALAERILAAAAELDYHPNSIAFSLRTRRSMTLGIVIPDITNAMFPPIVRGIEDALAPAGYMTTVVNTDLDPEKEAALIRLLQARGVDGLILASPLAQDAALELLAAEEFPAVTVNRMVTDLGIPSVVNDDASGIEQAIAHLVALGHRHIAHIPGPLQSSTGRTRHDAFCACAQKFGLENWQELITADTNYREEEGFERTENLLASGNPFTAIVAANDLVALGAIRALRSRGRDCPGDVSVTGFNDIPFVDRMHPPLTTVHIEGQKAGHRAGELILEMLGNAGDRPAPAHEMLPVQLVVRGTTGPVKAG